MQDSRGRSSEPLIAPHTTETFTVLPGRADTGLVILCDHASNAFPPGYGTLGMPPEQLRRHIAYDIGAAEVTRTLAAALAAPAIMTHYSRLLIDPNRGTDDPTLIMRLSDGAVVPGNRSIDASERERRIRLYHAPYHAAVDELIDACAASGTPPALLAIHSFTESWRGLPRPWHVGILWDADDRLAAPLLEALYAENDLIVGDNEPYSGRLQGDYAVAARHRARARPRARRDPPGPHPRGARAARLGGAAGAADAYPGRAAAPAVPAAAGPHRIHSQARVGRPADGAHRREANLEHARMTDIDADIARNSRPRPSAGSSSTCARAPTCRTSTS